MGSNVPPSRSSGSVLRAAITLQPLGKQRVEAEDVCKSMKEHVTAARWRGSSGSGRGAIRYRRRSESRDGIRTGHPLERHGREVRRRCAREAGGRRIGSGDTVEHVRRVVCGGGSGCGVIRYRRRGREVFASFVPPRSGFPGTIRSAASRRRKARVGVERSGGGVRRDERRSSGSGDRRDTSLGWRVA